MKKILVIGAGRSATTLIKYLLDHSEEENWQVTIADYVEELALEKAGSHARSRAIQFDIHKQEQRESEIQDADLVISLLPPHMHIIPAKDCLRFNTHMVTASYVSDEMKELEEAAMEAGLLFLNEVGADPGIDHMSAMEMIYRVREEGGKVKAFRSYCGALVTPECNNRWGYKFTWAPRNIILAGQGIARYLRKDQVKYLPYHHLFRRTDEIEVPGMGQFEAYANRDSLKYAPLYGLEEAHTLYRATLRMPGYCDMWNALIEIGMTDPDYKMVNTKGMTYRNFLFSFINEIPGKDDRGSLAHFLGLSPDDEVVDKLVELGLLSDGTYDKENGSPADILQKILEEKWVFEDDDVDMVVMQHQLDYEVNGEARRMVSSMVDKGRDHEHTAISRTVGLPAAMCVKLILQGKVAETGVRIPNFPSLFIPVLRELEGYGIKFVEEIHGLTPERA